MKYKPEVERAVIGAILIDNSVMDTYDINESLFYLPKHIELFKAIVNIRGAGGIADMVTLNIATDNKWQSDIMQICSEIFTIANIKYNLEILEECKAQRTLKKICLETLESLDKGDEGSDNTLASMSMKLSGITSHKGESLVSMKDIAKETLDYVERRYKHKGTISGITSGFIDIDSVTDGFQECDLIILAARPGMGKSALAMAWAQNAAISGYPVGVLSLEMGRRQLGIRSLASLSGVEMFKLRKGFLNRSDFDGLMGAVSSMSELPIQFSFSSWELSQIQKMITQMVVNHKVKMVFVDYLQLAKNKGSRSREREIGEISTTLKQLAKSFSIPIIALAQLNREVEKRENKRPMLSDLRDSGQIEQDADIIIFLHHEAFEDNKGVVNVIFAKGRNIGTDDVQVYFDGDLMQFKNLAKERKNK